MAHAPINGSTLRWTRKTMLVEREELARAAGTSEKRIAEFQTGKSTPTLRQLESFAKKLDRTPAFFFAPPPDESDVPDTADFRGSGDAPHSPIDA